MPVRNGDDEAAMSLLEWFRALDRAELTGMLCAGGFILLLSGGPLAISFAVDPADIESGRIRLSPPCQYKATHGEACPTCGLTRGFALLSHGELQRAAGQNRWSLAVYVGFWFFALASASSVLVAARRFANAPLSE